MRDVTSFPKDEDLTLSTDKRVNLIYGLNGTGKSTIARFLQSQENKDFDKCQLVEDGTGLHDKKVYCRNFIRNRFYEKDKVKGIFTLGKENKEAEEQIEIHLNKINGIRQQIESHDEKLNEINKEINNEKSALKNKVWKTIDQLKDTDLDFCLTGYKDSKEKFLQKVLSSDLKEVDYSYNDLKNEANGLSENEAHIKQQILRIEIPFTDIENNEIFEDVIVGTKDSYLSELIDDLDNSDWVMKGRKYLEEKDSYCPFCQQSLPRNFKKELESFFDEKYENKLKKIRNLHERYTQFVGDLKKQLDSESFKDESVIDTQRFEVLKKELIQLLEKNLDRILSKIDNPSERYPLKKSSGLLVRMDENIRVVQENINSYNERVKNKNKYRDRVREKFYVLTRFKYDDLIDTYNRRISELEDKKESKESLITDLNEKVQDLHQKIKANRAKITNIEQSISNINNRIRQIGIQGFEITKVQDRSNSYRIVRDIKKRRCLIR